MVGGVSNLLPYGTGICHYGVIKKRKMIVPIHSFEHIVFNLVLVNQTQWSHSRS